MSAGGFSNGFSVGFNVSRAAPSDPTLPLTVTVTVEGLPPHKRVTTTVSISDTE